MIWKVLSSVIIFFEFFLFFNIKNVIAGPLYGPSPDGSAPGAQVPGSGVNPPDVPSGLVPSLNGPGFNAPNNGTPSSGNSDQNGTQPNNPLNPMNPNGPQAGTSNQGQPTSNAPTFMNNAMPNSSNPFLPNNVSPGLLSGPLENAYLQEGVPQLAAPMMSAVYRPFGLTYFQPNPFQVTPQGNISVSGMVGEESNIGFAPSQTGPNQPNWGYFYDITPAVYYSNFDDYGYISLLADASYYAYGPGNIPPYMDEMGGISAGTYLGTRVFVGAQDLGFIGFTPGMSGVPLAFFTGINPYYGNMSDAEVGIALTPKVTFVQGASDMYFDDSGYGAGIMNIQSLTESMNYLDKLDSLNLSYVYQQGIFSLFPGFLSNGIMGTAMHKISPTTSLGVTASAADYLYAASSTPANFFAPTTSSSNFNMYSYSGIFTRQMTPSLSVSFEGGWNEIDFYGGQNFQAPMIDVNLSYGGPKLGLGLNAGEFMENMTSYGIEMGPEKIKQVIGYLNYSFSPKTSFFSSAGYTIYDFLSPYNYSNNFFQTLQPNQSYSGTFLDLTDGVSYQAETWLSTSLMYNLMDFSTNIPNTTVVDSMFLAIFTFTWNFN